jgi:hypothetical protein
LKLKISPETRDFCATLCRPHIFTVRVRERERVYKLVESFLAREKAKYCAWEKCPNVTSSITNVKFTALV